MKGAVTLVTAKLYFEDDVIYCVSCCGCIVDVQPFTDVTRSGETSLKTKSCSCSIDFYQDPLLYVINIDNFQKLKKSLFRVTGVTVTYILL